MRRAADRCGHGNVSEIGSRGFCGIDPIVGVPDTDRQIDGQDKYAACGGGEPTV